MANEFNKFTSSKAIAVCPAIQLAPGDVFAWKTERTKFLPSHSGQNFPTLALVWRGFSVRWYLASCFGSLGFAVPVGTTGSLEMGL